MAAGSMFRAVMTGQSWPGNCLHIEFCMLFFPPLGVLRKVQWAHSQRRKKHWSFWRETLNIVILSGGKWFRQTHLFLNRIIYLITVYDNLTLTPIPISSVVISQLCYAVTNSHFNTYTFAGPSLFWLSCLTVLIFEDILPCWWLGEGSRFVWLW